MTRVLIVDDEEGFTRLFKHVLEEYGTYEVRVENDSTQAFRTARSFEPNLIILDVIMPQTSGIEVAQKLREDSVLSSVPIIFLTATATRGEPAKENELLHGYTVLSKPISVDALQEAIESKLRGKG